MKREILFRGRRINTGAWELGFALMTEHNAYIVPYYNEIKEAQMMHSVDPETVGQFTGLVDKAGNKIFEGDIAKTNTDKPMVISWSNRHASFAIEREGWAFRHYFGDAMEANKCEVIGNIHDNPELLTINTLEK